MATTTAFRQNVEDMQQRIAEHAAEVRRAREMHLNANKSAARAATVELQTRAATPDSARMLHVLATAPPDNMLARLQTACFRCTDEALRDRVMATIQPYLCRDADALVMLLLADQELMDAAEEWRRVRPPDAHVCDLGAVGRELCGCKEQ
jgi:hypothetical protein